MTGEATLKMSANPGEPEAELERLIRVGAHREALELCAERYAASIGRLCMALLGSQAEAEDTTQEILLEAHAGFASWRAEGTFKAWLFTIARRRCAKALERRGQRAERLRLVQPPPPHEHAEDWVLRHERAVRARRAIATIRPSLREALVLRYGSELSFKEVGEACGIEEVTARKRVSRALARLRAAMTDGELRSDREREVSDD